MRLSEHHLERFIFQFRLLRNTLVAWRVAVLFLILARSCWRPVTDLKALLRSLLAFFSIFLLQKLLRHNIIFHSRHSFPAQTRSVHSDCKLKSTTNLTFSLQWSESQHWSYLAFQAKCCPLRLPTNLIPLSMCPLSVCLGDKQDPTFGPVNGKPTEAYLPFQNHPYTKQMLALTFLFSFTSPYSSSYADLSTEVNLCSLMLFFPFPRTWGKLHLLLSSLTWRTKYDHTFFLFLCNQDMHGEDSQFKLYSPFLKEITLVLILWHLFVFSQKY